MKSAVLASRRNIQKIARDEEALKSIKLHDDLIDTFNNDINKLSAKLKKVRGQEVRKTDIPFIETLTGKYQGDDVLEGFAANTEVLCDEEKTMQNNYDNEFYDMIVKDNMIIFDITSEEQIEIPKMSLIQLKDIIFKKLKVNKACDVFKLTVEHLRNAVDDSLALILGLLNSIIVKVVENNEHLGQIVSGINQEEKNIDLKLSKGRKNLVGLLGAGFPLNVSLALL